MALIICDECGKEISDKAATCVGCGAPVNVVPSNNAQIAKPKRNRKPKTEHSPEEEETFIKMAKSGASLTSIGAELNKGYSYTANLGLCLLRKDRIERLPFLNESNPPNRNVGASNVNPALVCQHCNTKGQVSSAQGTSVTKTSGGFFADLISGTKRTHTRTVTKFHCNNCGTSWEVA